MAYYFVNTFFLDSNNSEPDSEWHGIAFLQLLNVGGGYGIELKTGVRAKYLNGLTPVACNS